MVYIETNENEEDEIQLTEPLTARNVHRRVESSVHLPKVKKKRGLFKWFLFGAFFAMISFIALLWIGWKFLEDFLTI